MSGWIIAVELLLILGLVLGFGFWELWKLRRDRLERDARRRRESGGDGGGQRDD